MTLSPPMPRPASRRSRLFFAFASLLAALVLAGLTARPARATIYYAATNGLSTNTGSSWSSPRDFVSALAGAASGDQVWVKKGTYTGNFTATDGVAVYGGFNGTETSIGQRVFQNNALVNQTILDGNNSGTVYTLSINAMEANTLDGFTVQHGNGDGAGGFYAPDTSPPHDTLNIANCTFINNTATYGGGIDIGSVTTTISNCMFKDNSASDEGGGIYAGGATTSVTGCTFINNTANSGAGIVAASTTTNISGCTFGGSGSSDGNRSAHGSGIFASSSTSTIDNCTFDNNSATDDGGGIYASGGTSMIDKCIFTSNSATSYGGGIYSNVSMITVNDCTLTSNTSGNDGGGIGCQSTTANINGSKFDSNSADFGGGVMSDSGTAIIDDCTFSGNHAGENGSGGGVYADTTATIKDCTFTSNSQIGIFAYGDMAVIANTFSGNLSTAVYVYRGGTSSAPALVKDNLIVGTGTSSSDPDGIDVDTGNSNNTSYVTFANNTIVKTNIGIDFASNSGAIKVANNVLYGDDGGLNVASSVPTVTLSHNDFFNNVGYNTQGAALSETDLMVDPLFVNYSKGDYHLLPGSPMIDAGDDNYVVHGDTDLDDHPRIMGAHVDIGAYEGTEPAALTSLSPAAVQVGSAAFTLTLTGTYFLNTSVVDWNGTALTTTYVSMMEITASVPASLVAMAGSAVVTVANPGAYLSNSKTIAINPVATLSSLSPTSEPAGSPAFTLTVTGMKFVNGATVDWNGAALATTFVSATQLTASVPASDLSAMGTASVTVVNPGTAVSNALTFTITTPPAPTVTSFTPTSGLVGSVVTITGTNLASVTAIRFHNANATTFSPNAAGTQINILVPTGAATGTITVTTPGGSVKTATNFTVLVPPTITSFTPTSGPVGTVVTITGTNFGGVTRVRFHNANAVTYSANADGTQLTVTVPSGAGTGTITVDTPGGQVTSSQTFTVTTAPAPPTVTSFTPTSGPVGTVVTVTGTNLNGVTAVRFHNANASVFSANGAGTQLTVTVPTGAGTGTFTVTTPGGSVKTTGTFTVN